MPIYEYKCETCGYQFEAEQSIKDAPLTTCSSNGCRGRVKRLLSAPAIVFRGKGWHVTDYSGRSSTRKSAPACEKAATCPSGGSCPSAGE